jgi:cobalamin biosynthetic protein CobC
MGRAQARRSHGVRLALELYKHMHVVCSAPFTGHGDRIGIAGKLCPNAPQPWIDLSTAINPNPYPAPRASALARARLPDPQELWKLEVTAARAFGVTDPQCVLATSGSESVLRLLPHVLPAVTEAIIVWPTYSSHTESWQRLGVPISRIHCIERASPVPGSVITLVNPNSPDGSVTPREQLLEAHDKVAACDGFLVIDEAFADADPACSVADLAGSERCPRLLVLRSFGKFYGLAGVRLGFMIGAPALILRIRAALGEWPVAADAITAGLAAYTDQLWAERTRLRLRSATRKLNALLTQSGFTIVGGTSLFRLAHSELAPARFKQLLNAGILTRPFDHDTRLLRFGLPHGDTAWRRLRDTLRARP